MPDPEHIELPAVASPEAQGALQAMLVALQDGLRAALATRSAEDPALWSALDRAYEAYDQYLALVVAAHPMQCHRGCSACCHDNPHGVAGVEILRIVRALPLERRTALAPSILEASEAFRSLVAVRGPAGAMATQRALGRPCPLLGREGECGIYATRPVACRMFHALSPAAWCTPAHPDFARRVNPHLLPPLPCLQILGAISRILGLPASTTLWEGLADAPGGLT